VTLTLTTGLAESIVSIPLVIKLTTYGLISALASNLVSSMSIVYKRHVRRINTNE